MVLLPRCQDYLQIIRGDFGTTDNCGTSPSMDAVIELEFGDYTAVFRTSEDIRGEGFQMYSICFQPLERNLEGNTTPPPHTHTQTQTHTHTYHIVRKSLMTSHHYGVESVPVFILSFSGNFAAVIAQENCNPAHFLRQLTCRRTALMCHYFVNVAAAIIPVRK